MKNWRRIFSSNEDEAVAFVSPDGKSVSLVDKMHAGVAGQIISDTPGYREDYYKWEKPYVSEFVQSQERSLPWYFNAAENYIQSRGWIRVSKVPAGWGNNMEDEYWLTYRPTGGDYRDAMIFFISTLPKDTMVGMYGGNSGLHDDFDRFSGHKKSVEEWLEIL